MADYLHRGGFFAIIFKVAHRILPCARSEVGLSRLPVTEEIAGSNPVGRATESPSPVIGEGFSFVATELVLY